MITRIVKMTFRKEKVDDFLKIFQSVEHHILSFEGCQSMKLLKVISDERILFTQSIWENEEALERYRKSDLFRSTWTKTKALFEEPAEAWSLVDL